MAPLSPMMQQYFDIKKQHPDQLLFFRLGDFYEMFYDDAKVASRELDLVLTGRDCGQEERAPMCGIPYHSCEAYIARLIQKGYKVAICEQMEDPRQAKGVVRREVIRVVTPGTLIEADMLDEGSNNYILSIWRGAKAIGLAFADISTGHAHVTELAEDDLTSLENELARFSPSEAVFNEALLSLDGVKDLLAQRLHCCAGMLDDHVWSEEACREAVHTQFGTQTIAIPGMHALGGLLSYLTDTQKIVIERLVSLECYECERYMTLDATARRNLELVSTMRTGERRGSLLWVLDKTRTALGRRMLRRYLERPLCNIIVIEKRLNAVDELKSDSMLRMDLAETLSGVYDLERLLTRIVCGSTTPRELKSFEMTLRRLPTLRARIEMTKSRLLQEIYHDIDPMDTMAARIGKAISDDPPATSKDGGFIRNGFDTELDGLRELLTHTREHLARIEADERERTGIKNLKIGYNKVFGYYIEISNAYKNMAPPEYIRKQTLSNCERYITEQLKTLEEQILTARERAIILEIRLYEDLRADITAQTDVIQKTADAVARLDVFCSLAAVASEQNYCRPIFTTGGEILIRGGRHPVVEALLGTSQRFVANDCTLDLGDNQIAILTGPNMAGKSTYIRQVALIVLLAQLGSFVPAQSAQLGVVDGIYTRVGASDDLATGQSTFMVEMNEVSQILKKATSKSLLILDEVGRGTSTFDGMSIARAMLEYIAEPEKLGAKTLFATHYHELTELEGLFPSIKNYNTAVKKRGDDITFLRRIVPGAVDDSYGIEVSKLAGIPDWIIRRAHEILTDLEAQRPISERRAALRRTKLPPDGQQAIPTPSAVEEMLRRVDLNALSPLEALNKLYELKSML
ncbi:MAG: DNA mismatch repair protein MutS [Oscillospiraceae bacterium]